METSSFDIIGPAMVGPSSSHTAGAVRIGLLAHHIIKEFPTIDNTLIELHGSFAATGRGHATDRGIVAGLMGFHPDDERIKNAIQIAEKSGIKVDIKNVDLGSEAHPNTARLTFNFGGHHAGQSLVIIGASVGGGNVEIQKVDNYDTNLTGALDALVIWHLDRPGFLARVTALLACVDLNIATILTGRRMRDSEALTVIKTDSPVPDDCLSMMKRIPIVNRVARIPKF
ncbi:MAG: L-serine ammonia-lyase, iron-sulfur-dependent subunit beta [Opitutales bacterium]|nr:L-serine ammonia-lyase, iron-sulfur-dependent subunit beta [Opitutales bacterium]